MDSLVRKIKKLQRITPNTSWLDSQRSFLLYEIARTENQKQEKARKRFLIFPVFNLNKLFRPAFAIALASVVVVSSVATIGVISASQTSLPGDLLYTVKTTVEKTQLTFTSDAASRTKLSMKFATQRMDEVAQMMDKPSKSQDVGTTVKKFTQEMVTVQQNINNLRQTDTQKAVEVAKLVQTQTPIYEDLLNQSAEKLSYLLPEDREQVAADINQALQEVDKTKQITDELAGSGEVQGTGTEENQNPGEIITPATPEETDSDSASFEEIQEPVPTEQDTTTQIETQSQVEQ